MIFVILLLLGLIALVLLYPSSDSVLPETTHTDVSTPAPTMQPPEETEAVRPYDNIVSFELGDITTSTWYKGGKMDGIGLTVTNKSGEEIQVDAFDVRYNGVPVDGYNNIAYLSIAPGESVSDRGIDVDYAYLQLLGIDKLESFSVRFKVKMLESDQTFETEAYVLETDFECSTIPEFVPLSAVLVDEGGILYELVGYRDYPERAIFYFRYSNPGNLDLCDKNQKLYFDGEQEQWEIYKEMKANAVERIRRDVKIVGIDNARELYLEGGLCFEDDYVPAISYRCSIQLDEEGRQKAVSVETKVEDEMKWDTILASASRADKRY